MSNGPARTTDGTDINLIIRKLTSVGRVAVYPGAGDGQHALGRAGSLRTLNEAGLTNEAGPMVRFTLRRALLTPLGKRVEEELAARETRLPANFTPTMKAVLVQMVGGLIWTHLPREAHVLRTFRDLEAMGFAAKTPHPAWCKGNCYTHWVITEAGEEAAVKIDRIDVSKTPLVWDGQ